MMTLTAPRIQVRSATAMAVAGEDGYLLAALRERFDATSPGVLLSHARAQTASFVAPATDAAMHRVIAPLADTGFICLSSLWGHMSNWGYAAATTAMSTARTWLTSTGGAKTGKVAVVGLSMGFVAAANFAAANPTLVSALIGILPACDLDAFQANPTFTAEIDSRYSNDYATNGAPRSPLAIASTVTVPTLMVYATDDATVDPDSVEAFAAAAPDATLRPMTGDHQTASVLAALDPAELPAFLTQEGAWA